MIHANGQWRSKKALREAIASERGVYSHSFTDPSIFGEKDFSDASRIAVVGPSAYERKWYAQVTFVEGKAVKIS